MGTRTEVQKSADSTPGGWDSAAWTGSLDPEQAGLRGSRLAELKAVEQERELERAASTDRRRMQAVERQGEE